MAVETLVEAENLLHSAPFHHGDVDRVARRQAGGGEQNFLRPLHLDVAHQSALLGDQSFERPAGVE